MLVYELNSLHYANGNQTIIQFFLKIRRRLGLTRYIELFHQKSIAGNGNNGYVKIKYELKSI
jgi:hypothetical protein